MTTPANVVAVHMVMGFVYVGGKAKSALVVKSVRFYGKSGNYGPVICVRAGGVL